MKAMLKSSVLPVILWLLIFSGLSPAANIGGAGLSYKKLATYTNQGVQEQLLPYGANLQQIDAYLADRYPQYYPEMGERVANGPKMLAVASPQEIANMRIIGFTEETIIDPTANDGNQSPGNGRYVFLWQNNGLRAELFKKEKFDSVIKSHQIDLRQAIPFGFPKLKGLVNQIPTSETTTILLPPLAQAPKELDSSVVPVKFKGPDRRPAAKKFAPGALLVACLVIVIGVLLYFRKFRIS